MKFKFRSVLMASAAVLAGSFTLTSCDWFENVDNVTIPSEFEVTMSLNLTQSGEDITHQVEKSFNLEDNQDVAEYTDRIKEVTVESVTYRVEEYEAEGDDVILTNAQVKFSSTGMQPIQVAIGSGTVNLKTTTTDTALDIDEDTLMEIASTLKSQSNLTIVTSGTLSHAPVKCKIVMNVKTKVVAEAIE